MGLGKKKILSQGGAGAVVNTDNFAPKLYTGNGGTQSIDVGFKPDLVWVKNRGGNNWHNLRDSVRGESKSIFSNDSYAEVDDAGGAKDMSFDSNGFTLLGNSVDVNASSNDYVSWCWKGGGAAVSGTGTGGASSVSYSANTASGFSIVKYTKSGTSGTMTHGLTAAPELIIEKRRDGAAYWNVRVTGITGNNQTIYLNETTGVSTHPSLNLWSTPTTSVFGYDSANANAGNYIAYCFTSITGYQKIGSYTGTGATGNVINVGFKPRFILLKNADSGTNGDGWFMFDTVRSGSDVINVNLQAQDSGAESGPYAYTITVSNNGFEPTGSFANFTGTNASGDTYIYLAIA